jgi:hypothetical protein
MRKRDGDGEHRCLPIPQDFIDHRLILFRSVGTGGIDKRSVRPKKIEGASKEKSLQLAEALDNVRVFAQRSLWARTVCSFGRAGRIQENSIKQDPLREFLTLITGDQKWCCPQPIDMGSEDSETAFPEVVGDDGTPVLHELGKIGCFAPGRGAEVKDPFFRLGIKNGRREHGG